MSESSLKIKVNVWLMCPQYCVLSVDWTGLPPKGIAWGGLGAPVMAGGYSREGPPGARGHGES